MIPARLKLENFMCFSNIEINFNDMKTVCLIGNNGSGKSSVLDAITWALWEMARSKSDKLIKLGMNDMSVELEFSVNGERYKVIRFYRKGVLNNPKQSPKTVLELFYYDQEKGLWQPYSGKNIEETQKKLTNIIKMEYEAFSNSVYIPQNHSDTFLSKGPDERKRLLAEILGLGEYERLYRASKNKTEDLKIKAKILKEQINEGEIKQFSLKKLKDQKEELLIKTNNIQEQLSTLMQKKKNLESKNNHHKVLLEQQNLYSKIQQKYEDDINRTKTHINRIKGSIAHFKAIIATENAIKQQYNNFLQLKDNLKDYDSKELEYHKLKDRLIEFGSKQMFERYGAEHEYKKISDNLDEKLAELEVCRKIIDQSENIQKKYIEYQDLKEKVENLDNYKLEYSDLEVKIARLENIIDKFAQEYKSKIDLLEINIEEIIKHIGDKDDLIECISILEKEIKQYDKYDAELERVREKGISQREIIIDRSNKNAYLEGDLKKLKDKINHLQATSKDIKCPTCSGNILNTNDIIRKLEFEIDNLMIQIESNDNDASIAEDEMKFLRVAYKEKKKYLSKRSSMIFQLAELKTELKNLELKEQNVVEYKKQIEELNNKLHNEDFANEERYQINVLNEKKKQIDEFLSDYQNLQIKCKDLSYIEEAYKKLKQAQETANQIEDELPYFTMAKRRLEKELNNPVNKDNNAFASDAYAKLVELDYNLQDHISLRKKLSESQQVEYDYLSLQFALQQLPFLENNLAQLNQSLSNQYDELAKVNEIIDNIHVEFVTDKDINKDIEISAEEYESLSLELNNCNCNLAVINDRMETVQEALIETKERRKELDSVNKDITHYNELAEAFSRQGIQEVILESALPEIESEANKFLAKLSDNQMRISIKSSKTNKTGDIKDRLDIYIADNQGTRNYELYSGGEAFRINFAIRIALSKLLAKSREVELQTLIIDDAFGTQDQIGQEKLASIIKQARNEFDLVIIVTHAGAFANLFPNRIEIEKEAGSSNVRVVA